ncbi:hypothetical protein ccbrp13_39350 [Ktedonobacteria bacterium brp13]|nr:hypothetical protein ccbrp13_39350 [Ktedonobacteria bacterium brp13]
MQEEEREETILIIAHQKLIPKDFGILYMIGTRGPRVEEIGNKQEPLMIDHQNVI